MLEFMNIGVNPLLAAAENTSFFQTAQFMFGLLVAAVIFALWLGHLISTALRMPEQSGRLTLMIGAFVISLIVVIYGPLRFGVDLRGGVNFVGLLDIAEFPEGEAPTAESIVPRLMQRVDPSGTREIMIRPLGLDKIEVTIPDVEKPEAEEIWNNMVKTGLLQFRIVADTRFHAGQIQRAFDKLRAGDLGDRVTTAGENGEEKLVARWYTIAREEPESGVRRPGDLLPFKYVPFGSQRVRDKATGEVIDMTTLPFANAKDGGFQFAKYAQEKGFRNVQVLLIEPETEQTNVEGSHLTNASPEIDEMGRDCVSFRLTAEGSSRMGRLTSQNRPRDDDFRQLAIVLDGQLQSAPRIEEPIYRNGRITGSFTKKEVENLCVNLNSGKIEVALVKTPISMDFLKSTLGEELKTKGFWALGISLGLVVVFMLFYYRGFAGTIACCALALNLLLCIAFVIAIKQPMTLTGLAGLVLTIGMSVDANVLIFERIREELNRGSALRMAINNGFEKATVTIVDANVTTIITALVLYAFGTEQLKGFAVTLILGILFSMFTAVYCARSIFEIAERKRWITNLKMTQVLTIGNLDFLGKQGIAIFASVVLIIAGIAGLLGMGGRILDQDLKGGSTLRLVTNETKTQSEIQKRLDDLKLEVNGEKINFTVSSIADPELEGRYFKIDSTLPAPNPKIGDNWEPLDVVVERTFPGELKRHKLEFDPESIKVEEVRTGNSVGAVSSPSHGERSNPGVTSQTQTSATAETRGAPADSKQISWNGLKAPFNLGLLTSVLTASGNLPQDPQNTPPDSEKKAAEQPPTPPTGTNPASATLQQDSEGLGQIPPATTPPTDNSGTVIKSQRYRSTVTLNFENRIIPSSVQSLLVEASARLDKALENEQVIVTSTSGDPEDTEPAQQWQVTLETTDPADAKTILQAFQTGFNEKVFFPTSSGVGGQIAADAQQQALLAIFLSLLGIVAYVWVRFQSLAFGLAAVLALIHDVLIVLGAIALSNYVASYLGFLLIDNFKISLTVLAAILTVIGYSLNDTIVIFDRVREVRGKRVELNAQMINQSISQTFSRTILTSLTTFIVVFILYCFGGDSIHTFAFSLVVGIIAGTYSTIFIASPALLWFTKLFGNPVEAESSVPAKT